MIEREGAQAAGDEATDTGSREAAAAAPASPPAPPPPAKPVSGFSLMFGALLDRLKRLLGRR